MLVGAPLAHRPDSLTTENAGSAAHPRRTGPAMMTIDEFGRKLRAGEISAADMTDECLRRIDRDNARLNAFILVMADEARRQAREADEELAAGTDRGPLHGVPVSVKDLIDVRGTATTAASRVREGHRAERDAPIIAHLRQAGAVIVGKTNLHEFAFGTTNEDSAFGPARNPYDRCDLLADRAADRPRASSRAWPSRPSAPTPAARFAFRRPHAARSD